MACHLSSAKPVNWMWWEEMGDEYRLYLTRYGTSCFTSNLNFVFQIKFSTNIIQNCWILAPPYKSCIALYASNTLTPHDDVIKWKHFLRYWPFARGIHRSPVNSPHKGQWRGALMFSLICVWINGWVNNREAGDLKRYCTHYDVIVM